MNEAAKAPPESPKRTYQYLAVAAGCLTMVNCGMHYGWPSPSIPKLLQSDSHIPMTNDQSSWVVVVMLFGTVCGAYLGALVVDRIGRKNVLLLTTIPLCSSWAMLAFARSVPLLIIARFIAGISEGAIFCAFPMYMGEISDSKIRGFLGTWITLSLILGILLMNNIGSYLDITTAALVSTVVPTLVLVTFSWMPESPYYLLMKGNLVQARRNLKILRGTEEVEQELNRLVLAVELQNTNTGRYLDLFTVASNRRALYIMMGLRTAQQFSGVTAIMFYVQTIFKEIGNTISPSIGSSIYFVIQMIVLSFSSVIVDKAGRRPLLIISIIGSSLALFVEGCYFYVHKISNIATDYSWIPVVTLIIFVMTFGVGMHPIPNLMVGELFPTNVKAFAMSFCSNYYCIVTVVSSKFFQVTKDEFGMHVPFFVFSVCCVLGLLFIVFFMPETKGKTLEEIQEELGNTTAGIKLSEMETMVGKEP